MNMVYKPSVLDFPSEDSSVEHLPYFQYLSVDYSVLESYSPFPVSSESFNYYWVVIPSCHTILLKKNRC